MAEWDVGCDARFDYETRVESERERPKEPRVMCALEPPSVKSRRVDMILPKTLWILFLNGLLGLVCSYVSCEKPTSTE